MSYMSLFLLILIFLMTFKANAINPLWFLQDSSQIWIETDEQGRPLVFPGGTDEKYLARDRFGNLYKVKIKNALPLQAEVGASFLAEALGIPNLEVYPLLLRRGVNGTPTLQEAAELWPGVPLAGRFGEWFSATIQPASTKPLPFNFENLTAKQKWSFLQVRILNYLIDNQDSGKSGDTLFLGEHFTNPDLTQAFRFLNSSPTTLIDYLNLANFSFSQEEFNQVEGEITRFLSRVEQIDSKMLESLFGPYFEAVNSLEKTRGKPVTPFIPLVLSRFTSLRQQFVDGLASKWGIEGTHLNTKKLDVIPPAINIPTQKIQFGNIFTVNETLYSEALWAYYFQSYGKIRGLALERWSNDLQIGGEDVIAWLQEAIAKSPAATYYHVGSLPGFKSDSRPVQLSLNPHNAKTLFVIPSNDPEALASMEAVSQAGGHLLDIKALMG